MATGSWVNQDIYINATFTVNSYFIISNCWLRFGPNGKIIVDGHGAHLQSSGSYYFGCDGWAGIYVDGGSIVSMYADQVEDAQNAVTIASSYAPITLQSCFFNRNIVDIYVVAGVAANALITDNVFDCTSNTFLGSRSSIGIKVNTSATLTFGLPAGPTNVVRNHLRGASITSSTLNVRNGEFACNTVCGIQTTSGRLDLRTDLSFTNYNVFQLNRADIKTDNTNLFVEACQFFHCESDNLVSANNTLARPIDIHHNAFLIDNNNLYAVNHTKSAITIDRSSGALGLTYTNLIELNTVVVDAFTTNEARSAIRATGYPGTYDLMKIATNTVNIAQGGSNPSAMTIRPTTLFDVTVNSAEGFHVLGNHIYPTNIDNANNSNRWGFYVHDWTSPSSEHKIQQNTVLGTSSYDYGMCAFHFVESGPWDICDNQSDYTLRGFHFFNTCSPSVFGGNIMGHHQRSTISSTGATAGLLMEAQSVIGPQFCRHNKFTLPTYTPDDGAWHKGSFADFIASRFDYNPTITQETPVPVSPSSGWFLINTSDPLCTDSTSGYHCGESGHGYKDFLGEDELALIEENQMLYDPSSEAYAWEARRNLLAKLLRYPGLKSLYPAAQVFFDQQIGSSAGQFAQWNKQIDQAMLIEPNQLETLQQNRSQVSSLTEELDQLDATLTTPEAVTNADSSFFAARAVLLGQIKSLAVEESALTAAIELLRTPALASIAETLETLPHTAPYEQNQVFLNSLAVKKARAEAFSEEDYDLLRTIAAQCPDIVGTTRDRAMDYLPVGDPARIIRETRDEPNCLEERKIQSERVETASTELTLSPNPVESTLSVDFRSPFSGKIQVFALTGRTALWSADIQFEKYITIPAQQLGSGAYILMATDISGHRTVQKFAVSRK